ncbi:hypothetical protein C0989_006028 [Termitomyces sp. Mn162]|nr:hypothetical protein C0989_006028 [Termitomyces sp. Mn162]
MFQAKPITFQLESSQVAFATSYLQGIAFDHYTALLWFNPNNPVLSNWLAFTQEFSSKFGIFDTIVEAEENLFNLQMRDNERFTTFIVWFKWEAYKTGWNYNALRFALHRALPQQIKDVLRLTPKQTTYDGKRVGSLGLEDALDCGPDPDVFSAPALLLHTTILAPDNPPVHLPSHSSTNLLLHTTLPFTTNPVPTLVNSGATENFIDESLAALAPHPLRHLPAPISLKLFDGDPTPQELRLLITKLHPSAPIVLGFSWVRSTNPHVDWPSLTLCLNRDNPTDSGLVPFNVSPSSENSKATIDHPQTPPQLCSRSAQLFIINVQLDDPSKVFPALVNSSASGTFVSNQLGLWHNDLDRPLKLQLFDGSPTTTRITQYHDNTLTLDNNLQFQARLLITQLPPPTPIVLGLLWLQDVNPDINWKDLTMQFPSPEATPAPPEQPRIPQPPMTTLTMKEMPLCLSHPQSHYDGCLPTYPKINTKGHGTPTSNVRGPRPTPPPLQTQPLPL